MRFASSLRAFTLFVPLALGCSASTGNNGFGGSGGAGGTTDTTSSSTSTNGTGGDIGIGTDGGTGTGGAAPAVSEVFAHSASVLYRLDPDTKTVTTIGPFQGCGTVIDIAIDKNGVMFGTTSGSLYKVDKTNAKCTHIADGGYPNSLSFVPQGTVDPNAEALVGYLGSTYVRIDTTTGQVTNIGAISGGYFSSGDIVSVIGGGTYLTVTGNGCADCIIEVDPKTGDMKKMIGSLGHSSVFGLAFWGGFAYGFDDFGELFQIDLMNGSSTNIPMPNPPPDLSFYGAGSTTAAPIKPPE